MIRGEVWRVLIPAAPGHTQAGERPAIILQEEAFNNTLPTTFHHDQYHPLPARRLDNSAKAQYREGICASSVKRPTCGWRMAAPFFCHGSYFLSDGNDGSFSSI
jgi:hypothetical protein